MNHMTIDLDRQEIDVLISGLDWEMNNLSRIPEPWGENLSARFHAAEGLRRKLEVLRAAQDEIRELGRQDAPPD